MVANKKQLVYTGWPQKTGTLCFVRFNFVKY